MRTHQIALAAALMAGACTARADIVMYGTPDCLTTGCYGVSDPTSGATLQGLAPGVITLASSAYGHSYPFTPTVGDFPGTDQIYVGSVQTGTHDGYSGAAERINGPSVFTLDYSSVVGSGQTVGTLTLGIAADDFQFPAFGQPFTATVNGSVDAALTAQLNALDQTGPVVQYFTIGLNPLLDNPSHTLTLSIDEGGDGGDGWAVDFLTVGVTTTPEPSEYVVLACGLAGLGAMVLRRRQRLQ